jgi:hypothetical protein
MIPERENNGIRKNCPLLGNDSINTCCVATDMHTTTEELQEAVFSMPSVPRLRSKGHQEK